MKGNHLTRPGMIAVSVFLLNGCSLLFVGTPPAGDGPLPKGSCQTSVVFPALDVAMTGVNAALAVSLFGEQDIGTSYLTYDAAGALWLIPTAAVGLSAYQGFKRTSECRRRQALSEQAIADHVRTLARNARAPDDS